METKPSPIGVVHGPFSATWRRVIASRVSCGSTSWPRSRAARPARPGTGRGRTGLAAFWFARTRSICPNHLLALRPDGRSTECRRLEMLPIECVVRGYLSGSGWKDYQKTGLVCGHRLPAGLRESQQLPEPIFTPATKAQTGHDENIDRTA